MIGIRCNIHDYTTTGLIPPYNKVVIACFGSWRETITLVQEELEAAQRGSALALVAAHSMSEAGNHVDRLQEASTVSSAALRLPHKKTKASKLWKKFKRDPILCQKGPDSLNSPAPCLLCDGPRFQPLGNAGLMQHLLV